MLHKRPLSVRSPPQNAIYHLCGQRCSCAQITMNPPDNVLDRLAFWRWQIDTELVYVIRGEDTKPIKIGVAHDPAARIASLQTGNPCKLVLLHVLPGGRDLETYLHRLLRHNRVHGEWFDGRTVPRVLENIAKLERDMVTAYDGSGTAPDFAQVAGLIHRDKTGRPKRWRTSRPAEEVTVRFTDPAPKVPPDEAARMRESVRGCSRAAYLGPAPVARQRISPSAAYNL